MILLQLLMVLSGSYVEVQGQCPITEATIYIDNLCGSKLIDRNNLDVVIAGQTKGTQATSVIWKQNGSVISSNDAFFIGGGELLVDENEPCANLVYRVALGIRGYQPGRYSYTVSNGLSTMTSSVIQIQDPGPPTNIVLSQIGCRRAQATWTPPAGFPQAKYHVYVNTMDVNTVGAMVTDTSFRTDTFASGSIVTFRVRASVGTYLSVPAVSKMLVIRDLNSTETTTRSTMPTVLSDYPSQLHAIHISSTTVELRWFPVKCFIKNSSVSGYVAAYGQGLTTQIQINTNSTTTTHTVSALMPFSVYSFQVAGICGEDVGKFSSPIRLMTAEDKPTKVINLTATPHLNSVNIAWREPAPVNGIITNYIISYSVNRSVIISNTSISTSFSVLYLDPGTEVSNITVSASTAIGTGPPVTLNYTVTPLTHPYECFRSTSLLKSGQNTTTLPNSCSSDPVKEDIYISTLHLLWTQFNVSPVGRVKACPVRSCDEVSQPGTYWVRDGDEVIQKYCGGM